MKKLFVCFVTLFLIVNGNAFSEEKRGILDKIEGGLDRIFGQEVETRTEKGVFGVRKKRREHGHFFIPLS